MSYVFIATVLISQPERGEAVVLPAGVSSNDIMPRPAYLPYNDATTGVKTYTMPTAGTTVLCTELRESSMLVTYIIGTVNAFAQAGHTEFGGLLPYLYNDFHIAHDEQTASSTLKENILPKNLANTTGDHDQDSPGDSMPGDIDIRDAVGGTGLHIGELLSCLYAGPLAKVDVNVLNNTVRNIGMRVEDHTLTTEQVAGAGMYVRNTATSMQEAFGHSIDSQVARMDTDEETVTYTEPSALPLYRIQHAEGAAIGGREDTIVDFPYESDTHTSDTEPVMLSVRRQALSGALTDASTLGISSIKSPFVAAAHQVGYAGTGSALPGTYGLEGTQETRTKYDELREPYEGAPAIAERDYGKADEGTRITDEAINKLADMLMSNEEYAGKLAELMAKDGFCVSRKEKSIYGIAPSEQTTINTCGASDDAEYPPPPSMELTDPVTGRKYTYYLSTSFITQEPDGSICICDGYGSEIRMCRGNIYISPALDLHMRTGRDMSVMAGRHQSYNSQDTCTINTSTDMYVRACKDMHIAGATNGKGIVSLESMSKEEGKGQGMVVRSDSSISMTATHDLYIGRNDHTKDGDGITVDVPGSIVVDAGSNGTLFCSAYESHLDAESVVISGTNEAGGAAIMVHPTAVQLLAKNVIVPADVIMSPLQDECTIARYNDDAVSINTKIGVCNLWVNGSAVAKRDAIVEGTIVAKSAIYSGGTLGAASLDTHYPYGTPCPYTVRAEDPAFDPIEDFPKGSYAKDASTATANQVKHSNKTGAYSDGFINSGALRFPDYSVRMKTMPGMVWQERTRTRGKEFDTWKEPYIKDIKGNETACYPGYGVWRDAYVSKTGYDNNTARINDGGYIINAVKKEDAK